MEWLSQNWTWLALFAGVVWLFTRGRRGGAMGGCSMHGIAHNGSGQEGTPQSADSSRAQVNARAPELTAEHPTSPHRRGGGSCC